MPSNTGGTTINAGTIAIGAGVLSGIEPVLPERMSRRSYWLVIHEDVRSLGRIRATVDHIVGEVMKRRAIFLGSGS